MEIDTQSAPVSKKMLWAGWIVSALPVLMLLFSASGKFMKPANVVEGFAHLEWDLKYAIGLGIVEVACTVIYLIPRTSILGAILLTGYLGGAVATHVRIGDWGSFFFPIMLGALVWGGLWLRDKRVRALVPLRQ